MSDPLVVAVDRIDWYSPLSPPEPGRLVWIAVDGQVHPATYDPGQFGWIIACGPRERDYVRLAASQAWTTPCPPFAAGGAR